MASAIRNGGDDFEGVEFIREGDGSIITHDTETGLVRGGDTRAEALSQPAEVPVLHEGGGKPITNDDLREFSFDPGRFEGRGLPDFMQQMVWRTFSSREIIKTLTKYGYVPKSHHGGHVRLRCEHPETGEVRNADVPQHDELKIGILKSVTDQCGTKDFRSWCEWTKRIS